MAQATEFATGATASCPRPQPTQDALATSEWISRAENLVIAGPPSTGKSHLVEAKPSGARRRHWPRAMGNQAPRYLRSGPQPTRGCARQVTLSPATGGAGYGSHQATRIGRGSIREQP
jgi:hypothetical protein